MVVCVAVRVEVALDAGVLVALLDKHRSCATHRMPSKTASKTALMAIDTCLQNKSL
jgi:hypothetical protein